MSNLLGIYPPEVGQEGGWPSAGHKAVSWISDDGLLFLFGGKSLTPSSNIYYVNDLWSFNISSGNWTWRGGSGTQNPLAQYPNQVDGIGWPGSTHDSAYCRLFNSIFLFGGDGMTKRLFICVKSYIITFKEITMICGNTTLQIRNLNGEEISQQNHQDKD